MSSVGYGSILLRIRALDKGGCLVSFTRFIAKNKTRNTMTQKLFWKDPYQTVCEATITEINGKKVKLNQTIFYAFSGGQESDEGTIAGIKVITATKQGDKESIIDIEYELEQEPSFSVGDAVEVQINEERRKKLMKLHSAAHIVYYFVIEKLGPLKVVGSNITSEKARMDFLYEKPISELLLEIEVKVNHFLQEKHEILRKQDEKNHDLWWWMCGSWKMPCGGTHVKNTKEIGRLQLKRRNLGAGKERIEMLLAD